MADDTLTIWLAQGRQSVVLGTATGDEHGDFYEIYTLPRDLGAGNYAVLTLNAERRPVSSPLVVESTAGATDSEGLRDRSEPMLQVPVAEQASGAVQAPAPISLPAAQPSQAVGTTTSRILPFVGLAAVALLVLTGLTLGTRRKVRMR